MLKTAAILNFILAIGHIACMPWLDAMFRIYGIDKTMTAIASNGTALPYLITVVIALCFALCGVYALSATGIIRRLPLLRSGLFTIASIFLFRAVIGLCFIVANGQATFTDLSSVLVAGIIGLLYLLGGIFRFTPQTERLLSF